MENRTLFNAPSQPDVSRTPLSRSSTPVTLQEHNKNDKPPDSAPETPQKTDRPRQGLSLQMPQNLLGGKPGPPPLNRLPLSPQLDSSHTFGSPASVLPRRSRGLDFSRACTNLHHSTLAESSPDSSPVVGARGVNIPQRRGTGGFSAFGSPSNAHSALNSGFGQNDRAVMSGSVSSINMMDSDSSGCSGDDDESIHTFDRGDAIITTPQSGRPGTGNDLSTPFSANPISSPGGDWMGGFSAARASLLNFQRARFRSGRNRHNSASISSNSSKQISGFKSSPASKSLEPSTNYISKTKRPADVNPRVGRFSHVSSDIHLSDVSDDGESGKQAGVSSPSSGSLAGGSNSESGRRGVIRRAVTRRGNLLPKSKNFSRIRAALFEEGAPIESDAKREADVIRQVRENDDPVAPLSPTLLPSAMTAGVHTSDDTGHGSTIEQLPAAGKTQSTSFSRQVSENSRGLEFWNSFDNRYKTPPPSGAGGTMMPTPSGNGRSMLLEQHCGNHLPSDMDTPGQIQTERDIIAKANKRRRTDDLDLASFKRRAVSPAASAQSSPIQPNPSTNMESSRSGHLSKAIPIPGSHIGENVSVTGHSGHVKRVGLQGMNETNEGLMNMSID